MRDRLRREDGLTLVELLVTMTVSIIVLGAILLVAETVTTTSEANNRLTDAQDDARIASDAVARDIRLAGAFDTNDPIATALPGDLVLRRPAPVTAGFTGTSWTRYCVVGSGSSWTLRRVATDGAIPTGPCPTTAPAGALYDTPVRSTLARGTVFTFTCAATPCTTRAIRTVGIALAINRRQSTKAYESSSAVTLRNRTD